MTAPPSRETPCIRCGACCDQPGYVYVTAQEVENIAANLEMPVREFTQRYTRLSDDRKRLSLLDSATGGCAFLTADRQCRIQTAKPRQCRGFPWHWRYDGYEKFCAIGKVREKRGENP